MQWADHQITNFKNIVFIKQIDSLSVLFHECNVEKIGSFSSVSGSEGPPRMAFMYCLNAIKMYNAKMGGVYLMNQLTSTTIPHKKFGTK